MPPNYVLCFQILPITVSTAPSEAASPEAPFGRGRTQKRVICNNGPEGDLRDSLNMTLGSNTLTKLSKSAFRGNSDTYAGLLARVFLAFVRLERMNSIHGFILLVRFSA